jgi:TolB-like protein
LLAFNFIHRRNLNADILRLDKSIAVLPFLNESPVDSNKYFINGIMEEVLTNLQKIKDFRVLSRTSTDQYIGTDRPTIPEIAKKLGVSYIVEGSGQKYGNMFRLRVQLIKAKGKETHLWAKSYEQELRETAGLFSIQNQIAQAIAAELKAIITPEEKQRIEKVPTSSVAALDLYMKANDFLKEYKKTRDSSFYQNAVTFYKTTLVIDPSYAKAYTGLASAYYDRYQWETYFKENYLDSMLVLADQALSIDDQLDEAYYLKGRYYQENGQFQKALDNYDMALEINPNNYSAYSYKGIILTWQSTDYVRRIDNFHKALNLIRGGERPSLLRDLGYAYLDVGFPEKAKHYFNEAYTLDSSKTDNLNALSQVAFSEGNIEEGLKFERMHQEIDTTFLSGYLLAGGSVEEAYLIAKRMVERYKKSGEPNLQQSHRIGYAFWRAGKQEEAKDYFNQQIKYCEESIRLDRLLSKMYAAQYDLAATYAFLGEKEKAYKYLNAIDKNEIDRNKSYPLWWIFYIKYDPLFASIRNEEIFQKTLQNVTTNNQAEHERVRKWLEEQGML